MKGEVEDRSDRKEGGREKRREEKDGGGKTFCDLQATVEKVKSDMNGLRVAWLNVGDSREVTVYSQALFQIGNSLK